MSQERSLAVAFCSCKGGSGKSTLSAAIAVRAAQEGQVGLRDLDPQMSLSRWWEIRGQPDNPKLFTDEELETGDPPDVLMDVLHMTTPGQCKTIVLDCPPALTDLIASAIHAADVVIVPVRPSPLDIEAVDPVVELCRKHRKRWAFVLTHFDQRWKLSKSATPALKESGRVLDVTISYRQAYVGSMITGKTGPEFSGKAEAAACAEEIDALWKAIKKLGKE